MKHVHVIINGTGAVVNVFNDTSLISQHQKELGRPEDGVRLIDSVRQKFKGTKIVVWEMSGNTITTRFYKASICATITGSGTTVRVNSLIEDLEKQFSTTTEAFLFVATRYRQAR